MIFKFYTERTQYRRERTFQCRFVLVGQWGYSHRWLRRCAACCAARCTVCSKLQGNHTKGHCIPAVEQAIVAPLQVIEPVYIAQWGAMWITMRREKRDRRPLAVAWQVLHSFALLVARGSLSGKNKCDASRKFPPTCFLPSVPAWAGTVLVPFDT